jgi:GGDEF domain-containing protein
VGLDHRGSGEQSNATRGRFCALGRRGVRRTAENSILPEALLAAERLRRAISVAEVPSPIGPFKLTASVGVTMLTTDDFSAEQPLRRADAALYRAKAEGRDLVRYDPETKALSEGMRSEVG